MLLELQTGRGKGGGSVLRFTIWTSDKWKVVKLAGKGMKYLQAS